MIKATDRKLVVGLEIGTAKVAALVGESSARRYGQYHWRGQLPVTWYG